MATPPPLPVPTPEPFNRPHPEFYADNIRLAVEYLRSRYNPELRLIPEAHPPGGWDLPSAVNLVPNGDVEGSGGTLTGWSRNGAGAALSEDAFSGRQALYLGDTAASWRSPVFPVKGNHTYLFGGHFKGGGAGHFYLTLRFYGNRERTRQVGEERLPLKGTLWPYIRQSKRVVAPPEAVAADIAFEMEEPDVGHLLGDAFFVNEMKFWTMDRVYWLGDNRLASLALQPYEPEMAEAIAGKVASYQPYDEDHKADLLEGKRIPATPWIGEQRVLEEGSDYIIVGGRYTGNILAPWDDYADVVLQYSILAWRVGEKEYARKLLRKVIRMWDGRGLLDGPAKHHRSYAVYKLALFLIALQIIQEPFKDFDEVERRMWSNQLPGGGVVTGIGRDGYPSGGPNTETTALALLVYDKKRIAMLRGKPLR